MFLHDIDKEELEIIHAVFLMKMTLCQTNVQICIGSVVGRQKELISMFSAFGESKSNGKRISSRLKKMRKASQSEVNEEKKNC